MSRLADDRLAFQEEEDSAARSVLVVLSKTILFSY